jgi:uncharacterized membrane protein YozB (DUF420 family)
MLDETTRKPGNKSTAVSVSMTETRCVERSETLAAAKAAVCSFTTFIREGTLNEGILGTAASGYTDLVLLLELAMALALLSGAVLARKRKFRAHAVCQSTVLVLNFLVIALFMVPSFHERVAPKIPSKLGRPLYALATSHAVLGGVMECAGLYIVLAAGTSVLPEHLRIRRYKLWMRVALAGWWTVLLLGLATYARWYLPHLFHT